MIDLVIKLPRLFNKQREVIDSKARFKIVMGGRRFGKSFMCAQVAITKMLKGESLFYLCPEFSLCKEFHKHISKYLPNSIIKTNNKSDLLIELITGGSIQFFSGNAADNLRGRKYHYGIIDEASYIDNLLDTFYLVIRPTLSDFQGGILAISTPRGKGDFYSLYQKGLNKEDDFDSFHFTTYDNPYMEESEIEAAKQVLTQAQFNQEYLAIAGENSNNPFGTDNITRAIRESLSTKPSVVYGIDFGRVNDYTVITGQDEDGNLSFFERFKLPWEQTTSRVKQLRDSDPYTLIVVDSTGVGSVLLERLQVDIYNIVGFEFTGKSKPIIIHDLIKDMETGSITINDMIAQEMSTYEFKYTSGGNLSYNAASGYHDDTIASLAMCNYYRKKTLVRGTDLYVF